MLISYVLDAGTGAPRHGRAGGALARPHADRLQGRGRHAARARVTFDLVDIERATAYAAEDADVTLRLWLVLKPRLAAKGLVSVYERLERPLVPVLARMEQRGISVDRQILSRLSGELAQRAAALEDEIYELAGERFNIGSPKQLGDILFGSMGLPGGSKTKTGQWSTSAQVLEDLAAEGHELPRKIVDWRQLTKLKSTYTDALPGYIHPETKRVHTSYALAATTTGRLSSSEPNLQNIPVRTAEGPQDPHRLHRRQGQQAGLGRLQPDRAARARPCRRHSAAEAGLRRRRRHPCHDGVGNVRRAGRGHAVAKCAAAPRRSISASSTASRPSASPTSCRSRARKPATTSRSYFERFPGIRDYMEETKAYARENGYVETIFGRRIHYPEIRSSNPSIRAFNERAVDQRADPGLGRRHHPPRHDAHGRGAGQGRACRRACCCRCTTN